ncbi:hypothetical protein PFLmoz3_02943 [Pseudomonas fluorescens]|uniref:Uncharacterized protein n=1 Tax=Pseudomonas fluorescens TaxID=294 RepID=A0A109LFY1_PSEFL|nr:hypothetical protein PFLmoz3_02943 [Pseudomonas fluorescens]
MLSDSQIPAPLRAASSARMSSFSSSRLAGRKRIRPIKAITPITVTAQKVERQPASWPSAVPRGTPSTFARVNPVNINATADARLLAGTRLAATTEPMPKNAPWHNAVTTRANISTL